MIRQTVFILFASHGLAQKCATTTELLNCVETTDTAQVLEQIEKDPKCSKAAPYLRDSDLLETLPEIQAFKRAIKGVETVREVAANSGAIPNEEYTKVCDLLHNDVKECFFNVVLPVVLDSISTKGGDCCATFADQVKENYGLNITETAREAYNIADSLVCDTRRPEGDREQEQTCAYTLVQGAVASSAAEMLSNIKPLFQIPSATAACDAFNGKSFSNGLQKPQILFPLSPLRECGRGYAQLFAFAEKLYELSKENEKLNRILVSAKDSLKNERGVVYEFDDVFSDGTCVELKGFEEEDLSDMCVNLPSGFSDKCWDPKDYPSSATFATVSIGLWIAIGLITLIN